MPAVPARSAPESRAAVLALLAAFALATFFFFPGHTWLASDTQIYAPLLEHLRDPALLARDLIVTRPHLGWTAYDEIAIVLQRLTSLSFEQILALEQLVFRFLALCGVYLIARGCGFRPWHGILCAAVYSLGVTIPGPAIFTVEADPVPRGFALGMVLLALGFLFCNRWTASAIAGALALLLHAPLALPFWLLFAGSMWKRRNPRPLIALASAVAILLVFWWLQPGGVESPALFHRIDPAWEAILRFRAAYVFVSLWPRRLLLQYALLFLAAVIAVRRARAPFALLFLPAIGILSPALSWLLLEGAKWSLMPQFQPARYVLFVSLFAQLLAVFAAIAGGRKRRYVESAVWMALALALTVHPDLFSTRWKPPLAAANVQSPHLDELCRWAQSTPLDAMFQFPEAGRSLVPGVFRAQARRALYVDWKAGGQANFFAGLATEWSGRWRDAMNSPADPARLRALGIDYVVVTRPLPGIEPVFRNRAFLAYRLR